MSFLGRSRGTSIDLEGPAKKSSAALLLANTGQRTSIDRCLMKKRQSSTTMLPSKSSFSVRKMKEDPAMKQRLSNPTMVRGMSLSDLLARAKFGGGQAAHPATEDRLRTTTEEDEKLDGGAKKKPGPPPPPAAVKRIIAKSTSPVKAKKKGPPPAPAAVKRIISKKSSAINTLLPSLPSTMQKHSSSSSNLAPLTGRRSVGSGIFSEEDLSVHEYGEWSDEEDPVVVAGDDAVAEQRAQVGAGAAGEVGAAGGEAGGGAGEAVEVAGGAGGAGMF